MQNLADLLIAPIPPPGNVLAGHFKKGPDYACVRPRGSRDWLLTYTKKGRGLFRLADGHLEPRAGRLTLLPPGTPHDYRTMGKFWEFYWVHFLPLPEWRPWEGGLATIREIDFSGDGGGPGSGQAGHALVGAFQRLLEEQDRSGAVAGHLAAGALAEILLLALRQAGWKQAGGGDPKLNRVLGLMGENLGEPMSLLALASATGLSVSGFSHWFAGRLGLSPMRYRQRLRLAKAAQILRHTVTPLTEVASDLGFFSVFHFSNQFKQWYGQSPRAWRKKNQGEGA